MKYLKLYNYNITPTEVVVRNLNEEEFVNRITRYSVIKNFVRGGDDSSIYAKFTNEYYEKVLVSENVILNSLRKIASKLLEARVVVDLSIESNELEINYVLRFSGGRNDTLSVVERILSDAGIGEIIDNKPEENRTDNFNDYMMIKVLFKSSHGGECPEEWSTKCFDTNIPAKNFNFNTFCDFFMSYYPVDKDKKDSYEMYVYGYEQFNSIENIISMRVSSESLSVSVMSDNIEMDIQLYQRYDDLQNFVYGNSLMKDFNETRILVTPNSDRNLDVLIEGKWNYQEIYLNFKEFINEILSLNNAGKRFGSTWINVSIIPKDVMDLIYKPIPDMK